MENRATFPDSLEVGLQAYYDDQYARYEPMHTKIFNLLNSTKAQEEFSGTTGIKKLTDVGEGGSYSYTDEIEDYKTTIAYHVYKAGIQVTEEELSDDQYRDTQSRLRKLAMAAARTRDHWAFSVFRNAFNTSYTSYGDGKPICSTSHTRLDGGTARSNASATSIPLSEANLETGLLALDEVLDHQGELVGGMGDGVILLVPPALRKLALEIVGSPLRSGIGTNDLNYYALGDIDVMVCPWISALAGGSDTAFFLVKKMNDALQFVSRVSPSTRVDVDDETDNVKFKVKDKFGFGWTDPVSRIWGSQGTEAAYSF